MFGAPSASSTSFSFGTSAAAPASAASAFGVPASAPAASIFGASTPTSAANIFGAPATNTFSFGASPATTTSFGQAPTAPAQAANPFGAPTASPFGTSSFGFSAPTQASNNFGAATSAFGAPAANFGFSGAAPFGAAPATTPFNLSIGPTAASSVVSASEPQITMNTRFTQLPELYRNVIEQTNSEYKKTMREGLDEIARFQPKMLDELRAELGRTSLAALKLGNQQDVLLGEIRFFHDKAKDNLRDVRKYGVRGLQQIQNRGGLGTRTYMMSEELPTDFYLDASSRIEDRLVSIIEEVQSISRQLLATIGLISGEEGQYGQQTRIGPQHLVKLIQGQSEAFARVAASVAEVHSQADEMRASYLRSYCSHDSQTNCSSHSRLDPFAAADRAVAANQRLLSRKFKAEEFNRAYAAASPALPQTAAVAPTTSSSIFPGPASATTAGYNFGTGAFGNSFTGFAPTAGATPVAASPFGAANGFGGLGVSSGGFGGAGFKALDLATTSSTLGFGAPLSTPAAFGTGFGTGSTTSRKSGSKSRK